MTGWADDVRTLLRIAVPSATVPGPSSLAVRYRKFTPPSVIRWYLNQPLPLPHPFAMPEVSASEPMLTGDAAPSSAVTRAASAVIADAFVVTDVSTVATRGTIASMRWALS